MSTAEKMRSYTGPALFSFGFRPFFLLAAAWPALTVPLWVLAYLGYPPLAGMLTRDWHAHEMLFGYLSAVMAGFLLTAVPNWTGRLPVMGEKLAMLVGLWLAGRIAMIVAPLTTAAAIADCAFLVVFAGVVGREVLAGDNRRNLPVCGMVSLFALANIGAHLWPLSIELALTAERLALAVAAMMIALIGGRITPSFTRNWLTQRRATRLPAAASRVDIGVLALTGAALVAWVAASAAAVTGFMLIAAGMANLARLSRWRGVATWREPLVWIMHAGYGWMSLALALLGASVLASEACPFSAGVHALTAGAVGVMTLAVMTRAILGHTGRSREAGPGTVAIYLLANLAAVLRVAAALAPTMAPPLLGVSATAWSLAFCGFLAIYGPMCVGPRADGAAPRSARPAGATP